MQRLKFDVLLIPNIPNIQNFGICVWFGEPCNLISKTPDLSNKRFPHLWGRTNLTILDCSCQPHLIKTRAKSAKIICS